MWNYTDKVMGYFLHPRNVGEIADADGVGEVGNIVCGDAMKLYVKMSPDGRTIADVKFQTFGCASAIASASALTEMLKGKTLEEARRLTNQDIADYLGELPEEKMHCSVMGSEAFDAALKDLKAKHPEWEVPVPEEVEEGAERIVCHCFSVTEGEIRKVIRENHLTTVEQVTHFTKAGGGCGGCRDDIQAILDGDDSGAFDEKAALLDARLLAKNGDLNALLSFFAGLDILDSRWRERLSSPAPDAWQESHRALSRYLVRRFWLQTASDGDLYARVKLIVTSVLVIRALGKDAAFRYAREVFSDPENLEALLTAAYSEPAMTDERLLALLQGGMEGL